MFRLDTRETYDWPITIYGIGPETSFIAKFRRLPKSRIDFLLAAIRDGAIADVDLIGEVLAGWDGIVGADDAPVPYSHESLMGLLDIFGVAPALLYGWIGSLEEIRRKNSQLSPGTGSG